MDAEGVYLEVQSWVDAHDGEFGILVVLSCDTDAVNSKPPKTLKSLLAVGDGIVRGPGVDPMGSQHNWMVTHPIYGEINEYTSHDAYETLINKTQPLLPPEDDEADDDSLSKQRCRGRRPSTASPYLITRTGSRLNLDGECCRGVFC